MGGQLFDRLDVVGRRIMGEFGVSKLDSGRAVLIESAGASCQPTDDFTPHAAAESSHDSCADGGHHG